jgi:hypothetical protein
MTVNKRPGGIIGYSGMNNAIMEIITVKRNAGRERNKTAISIRQSAPITSE